MPVSRAHRRPTASDWRWGCRPGFKPPPEDSDSLSNWELLDISHSYMVGGLVMFSRLHSPGSQWLWPTIWPPTIADPLGHPLCTPPCSRASPVHPVGLSVHISPGEVFPSAPVSWASFRHYPSPICHLRVTCHAPTPRLVPAPFTPYWPSPPWCAGEGPACLVHGGLPPNWAKKQTDDVLSFPKRPRPSAHWQQLSCLRFKMSRGRGTSPCSLLPNPDHHLLL